MEKNKKSVGIITMHRVINYGSFLQAYATQEVIKSLGHKCEIIDYAFPNKWHYDNGLKRVNNFKSKVYKMTYPAGLFSGQRKEKKINNAIKKYLNLSTEYMLPEELQLRPPIYDIYLTGSDQTWNPKHTLGDDSFLLSFVGENKKKISFSPSIADGLFTEGSKNNFKNHLQDYSSVSVRDKKGQRILHDEFGIEAQVTLDPTLMLNKEQWLDFGFQEKNSIKEKGSYIAFYLITHSFNPTPYIYELLKELQLKTGHKVMSFSDIPDKYDIKYEKCSGMGVEEFIQLFGNAKFVVTSSFHGTAFAANFGVPLYSVVSDKNAKDDRQASLLKLLQMDNCLVEVGADFGDINPFYKIETQQERLEELRQASRKFLESSINS